MNRHEVEHYLDAQGPWSFAESVRFLEGFAPAAMESSGETALRLAFVPDGEDTAVGVSIQPADGRDDRVVVRLTGDAPTDSAVEQVRRILSLDHDGRGIPDVVERDPVIGQLWRDKRFLRPVLFHSPYEAAAWAIIGNRIRIRQAATIKAEIARELGTKLTVDGVTVYAFPPPAVLAEVRSFPGLTDRKVGRLRGIGEAAQAGLLSTDRIRSMEPDMALAALTELAGIGPFGAELILLRGAGERDRIPRNESRFGRAVALAYGLDAPPSDERLTEIATAWAPYRTWVAVLLRSVLEDHTQEIAGQ